jgi:hypothetical protein
MYLNTVNAQFQLVSACLVGGEREKGGRRSSKKLMPIPRLKVAYWISKKYQSPVCPLSYDCVS